jgi:DNA-binding SARP family transcriptional activator
MDRNATATVTPQVTPAEVSLRGAFRVRDAQGVDRTPRGMKERALLALLLLSPGQRRTRAWVQDKLWSDRNADQASVSCRQALANVRKALGPLSAQLRSDRSTLWLDPPIPTGPDGASGPGELLADLDVRDPEFANWLRDLRQADDPAPPSSVAAPASSVARQRPVIHVQVLDQVQTELGLFLARALAHRVAGELVLAGDVDVMHSDPVAAISPGDMANATIELRSFAEEGVWFVLIRVLGPPSNRCVWTGRLRLPMQVSAVWDMPDTTHLVNRAVSAVTDLIAISGRLTPFAALQRAVRRVYDFDQAGLGSADSLLRTAQDSELSGLALAWRGFVRLTAALEFRDNGADLRGEAAAFCEDALARASSHPVVLGLSAQVQMKLGGDMDLGQYLARRAAEASDQNPYALDALSQAMFFSGDYARGHEIAEWARQSAGGLHNSFSWDMQCCLSALSLGRYEDALAQALSCHRKMPAYRPALRYLVALNLLAGRKSEAAHFAQRLKAIEPDFAPALLLSPGYPVETLRTLGLVDTLRPLLG